MATQVVVDCGGHTIKAGFSGDVKPACVLPNCTAAIRKSGHVLIGDETRTQVKDYSQLMYTRPLDRGYLVDWDCQKAVLDHVFAPAHLGVQPESTGLLMTVAPFTPEVLLDDIEEVIFEEYGFSSFRAANAALLAAVARGSVAASSGGCIMVVDSGFSFTHAVPIFDDHVIAHGVRRVNVGGKLLTNYLKEIISYRAWNMMDETYLVNEVKEAVCYCSLDFRRDLATTTLPGSRNTILREYVLPDFSTTTKGYVRERAMGTEDISSRSESVPHPPDEAAADDGSDDDECVEPTKKKTKRGDDEGGGSEAAEESKRGAASLAQSLTMNNERICVPEVLFNPSNIGLPQGGVAQAVISATEACPEELRGPLLANIVVTGGNAKLPNFARRLEKELRSKAPSDLPVKVFESADPITSVWRGGSILASQPGYVHTAVSKKEWDEHGHRICRQRFLTA